MAAWYRFEVGSDSAPLAGALLPAALQPAAFAALPAATGRLGPDFCHRAGAAHPHHRQHGEQLYRKLFQQPVRVAQAGKHHPPAAQLTLPRDASWDPSLRVTLPHIINA